MYCGFDLQQRNDVLRRVLGSMKNLTSSLKPILWGFPALPFHICSPGGCIRYRFVHAQPQYFCGLQMQIYACAPSIIRARNKLSDKHIETMSCSHDASGKHEAHFGLLSDLLLLGGLRVRYATWGIKLRTQSKRAVANQPEMCLRTKRIMSSQAH